MKQTFLLLGLLIPQLIFTQISTDQQNLEKYWKLRNTFREQFIKIGPNDGESLPAGALKPCDCVDDLNESQDGTPISITCYGEMLWGDGMIRHGHYLGLLATEYRLLKNSGQDVTGVLYELYYAISAINRLDLRAETDQDEFYGISLIPELNGFFLREDVPQNFANYWANDEANVFGTNSANYYNKNASGGAPDGVNVFGNSYQNVPSNDQVSSLLVGLSLIHKLVDNVLVQPPMSETGFHIVTETAAIVDRIVRFASDHNWFYIDVNGWPVANGGGDMAPFSLPMLYTANRISNQPFSSYDLNIIRQSTPFNWLQPCITGFGSDDQIPQDVACALVIEQTSAALHYDFLTQGIPAGLLNNQDNSIFQAWELGGNLYANVLGLETIWQNLPNEFMQTDWIVTLPPYYWQNVYGSNLTILSNYGVISGLWSSQMINFVADYTNDRRLELTNAILHNNIPSENKEYYKSFLDGMTMNGPFHLTGGDWQATLKLHKFHPDGWGTEFRWTDFEGSLNGGGLTGIYNGIDYMLYHNLYYLLYEDQLPEYKETYTCNCASEIVETINNADILTTQNLNNYSTSVISNSIDNLNEKLTYLPNCTKDVFEPVNHVLTSVLNINPKFSNYTSLKILTNKFQTENATVASNGQVNLSTRLIICNAKTLNVNVGGRIDIYDGELILNDLSILDISGEVHLHGKSKLILKGSESKIKIRNGGKLILDDNSIFEINSGTILEYYNGAQIISNNANSEIYLNGSIKMMNGGTFEILQQGVEAGKLIIDHSPVILAYQPSTIKLYGKFKGDSFITIKKNTQFTILNHTSAITQISKLEINDCSVILEENAQIQVAQPYFSKNVIYSSSENDNGIHVTDLTRFNNCDFINVGIIASLFTENQGKIFVYNCLLQKTNSFPDFESLINVEGMGYDMYNTTFKGKNLYCVKSNNLTYPSYVRDCQFFQNDLLGNGNTVTGVSDNSNVEIKFFRTNFHHLYTGIIKNSGKMSLKCNTFNDIVYYNLSANNHCLVNISTNDYAGYNSFGKTNVAAISLNSSNINVNLGRNYFSNLTPFYVSGTLDIPCGINTDCSVNAAKNQWSNTLAPPLASKFSIFGTDNLQFMVSANQTEALPLCGYYDVTPGPVVGLPSPAAFGQNQGNNNFQLPNVVTHFNPSIRLDRAVNYGMNKMKMVDSVNGDDIEALAVFDDIFKNNLTRSPQIMVHLERALGMMKTAHESALSNGQINSSSNIAGFDTHTQKYVDALNYMTDTTVNSQNYVRQFYHELDKAHFYRVINQSEMSIQILNELEYCGLDLDEQKELNYWKKQYLKDLVVNELGVGYLDTVVNIDTSGFLTPTYYAPTNYRFGSIINSLFDISYLPCDIGGEYRMAQSSGIEAQGFSLFPNPTNNIVNVTYTGSSNENRFEIRILSMEGKMIHKDIWDSGRMSNVEIDVSQWEKGTYVLEIINKESIEFRQKFVVLD